MNMQVLRISLTFFSYFEITIKFKLTLNHSYIMLSKCIRTSIEFKLKHEIIFDLQYDYN